MGDVWRPDVAVSRYVVRSSLEILEESWQEPGNNVNHQIEVATAACIIISGYFGGLRGEEISKANLGAIRRYWNESTNYTDHPHIPLVLVGRFKGQRGEKLFCQPLAFVTNGGCTIGMWFIRLIKALQNKGREKGPLFRNEKKKAMTVGDMDFYFHKVLKEVQRRHPSIISESVNVEEDYSVSRSLRRGATAEARNVGICSDVINMNNKWRSILRANGMNPGMTMIERYTDAKVAAPTLIRFSKELPT